MIRRLLPILISLAAFIFFAVAARNHPLGTYATETDFYHFYGPDAERIAAGLFPENPYQGPGYPALVALLSPLAGGDFFTAGKWISVVCASIAILLVYLLFARLFGFWVGIGASLLTIVAPQFPQFAISASTDALFLMLALAALLLLIEPRIEARWRVVAAGALTGLAYLTRYNGLFLLAAGLAGILLLDLFGRELRARARLALIFLAVFLVTASPWLYANYRHRGSPFYSANHLNMATEFYPELVDGRWNQDGTRELASRFSSFGDVIAYDPPRVFKHYPANLYESLRLSVGSDLVSAWVGWAALAGIAIALWRRRTKAVVVVLLAALIYFLLMGLTHWETRYYFFLMAVYSGFAVYAGAGLIEALNERGYPGRRYLALLPVALFAIFWATSFVMARSDLGGFLESHPTEVLAACAYLEQQGVSNARVLARKPHLPYICGQQWVFFPDVGSIDELGEWLKANRVDFVAFGVREVKARPELKPLRDVRKAPKWLEAVWRNEDPPLILYRPVLEGETR